MAVLTADTLPKLLLLRASENGRPRVALREKEYGVWQRVTWEGYLGHVRRFCLGLLALGLSRGDKIAILSENCREWLYAELAAMSASAVGVGVYPTSPAAEVKYVVAHSESVFAVVQDQEQADKILEVIAELPLLKKIVVMDRKGMRAYTDPRILSFGEVEAIGAEHERNHPRLFREMAEPTSANEVAFLIYTSGTTGFPKGAMISHRNILSQVEALSMRRGSVCPTTVVSYLPLCHVAEQIFSVFLPLSLGMTVNFAESVRTIQEDLREIAPRYSSACRGSGRSSRRRSSSRSRRPGGSGAPCSIRRSPPGRKPAGRIWRGGAWGRWTAWDGSSTIC